MEYLQEKFRQISYPIIFSFDRLHGSPYSSLLRN